MCQKRTQQQKSNDELIVDAVNDNNAILEIELYVHVLSKGIVVKQIIKSNVNYRDLLVSIYNIHMYRLEYKMPNNDIKRILKHIEKQDQQII